MVQGPVNAHPFSIHSFIVRLLDNCLYPHAALAFLAATFMEGPDSKG
jgi:hypothetical protein